MFDEEKKGGSRKGQKFMGAFKEAIDVCQLIDPGFKGPSFTWRSRPRGDNIIKERLGRFLLNQNLLNKVEKIIAEHRPFHSSDHRPILATIVHKEERSNYGGSMRRPKFECSWVNFEACRDTIRKCWRDHQGLGLISINNRVINCLEKLAKWNKERLKGSLKGAIERQPKVIQDIDSRGLVNDVQLISAEKALERLLNEEELYWKMRSR